MGGAAGGVVALGGEGDRTGLCLTGAAFFFGGGAARRAGGREGFVRDGGAAFCRGGGREGRVLVGGAACLRDGAEGRVVRGGAACLRDGAAGRVRLRGEVWLREGDDCFGAGETDGLLDLRREESSSRERCARRIEPSARLTSRAAVHRSAAASGCGAPGAARLA